MDDKIFQKSFSIDYKEGNANSKKDTAAKKEKKEISDQVLEHPYIIKLCEHLNIFTAMGLCILSIIAVLIVGGVLFIWPVTQNYLSIQKKIKDNKSQIKVYKVSKANIEKNQKKDLNNPLAVYKNSTKAFFLNHQSNLFDRYDLIVNKASFQEKAVKVQNTNNNTRNRRRNNRSSSSRSPRRTPSKANNQEILDFKTYDYHLILTGDYVSLGGFLEDLYQSNLLCVVKDFSLKENAEEQNLVLDIKMEVNIYVEV